MTGPGTNLLDFLAHQNLLRPLQILIRKGGCFLEPRLWCDPSLWTFCQLPVYIVHWRPPGWLFEWVRASPLSQCTWRSRGGKNVIHPFWEVDIILSKLFEEVIPRTSSRIWAEDWRAPGARTRGRHNPGLQSYTETDRTRLVWTNHPDWLFVDFLWQWRKAEKEGGWSCVYNHHHRQ